MDYSQYTRQQLEDMLDDERKQFRRLQKIGKSVDMTRGRPSKEQLDLSMPMLKDAGAYDYLCEGDLRNYGDVKGTKAARNLFAELLDVKADDVIVADGSSLNLMYSLIDFIMDFGVRDFTPWGKLPQVKFICPSPGYDRHFSICQQFGIEMIAVGMNADGPDMDVVESLVSDDDTIKGMWCVPKYSNPTGITYSDKVVERIASMKTAAGDFTVMWDNAYAVHDLYDNGDKLKNVFDVAKKFGTQNRFFEFASTSKITFPGSGIVAVASSSVNVEWLKERMLYKTISPNRINQTMHANFLKNADTVKQLMQAHADLIRPKFELVESKLAEAFDEDDYVAWTTPMGGYFISLDVKSCAKRIVEIAATASVKFTPAGATYPYKLDDYDRNIRIAPTVPSIDDLGYACDVLVSSIKQARMELLLSKMQ